MGGLVALVVVVFLVGGAVGAAIGNTKGRPGLGFVLGGFLGWIGWIIIAVMSRTPQAEAQRGLAVAEETRRLTGAPPLLSPTVVQLSTMLESIQKAARADADSAALLNAIDRFETFHKPTALVLSWFFASEPSGGNDGQGRAVFVARVDGRLIAASASSARELDRNADLEYTVTTAGDLVEVRVGTAKFKAPRPPDPALRLLNAAKAVRVEVDPPLPLPPPEGRPATVTDSSVESALRTLAELHANGLISADEYELKRRQVLDRI